MVPANLLISQMVRICVYQGKQLFEMSVTTNRKAYGLVYLSSMAPLKEATPQLNSVRLSLSLYFLARGKERQECEGRSRTLTSILRFKLAAKAAFPGPEATPGLWPTWSGAETGPRRRPSALRGTWRTGASSASSLRLALSGMPRMAQRIQNTQRAGKTHNTGREEGGGEQRGGKDSHCSQYIDHFNFMIDHILIMI